MVILGVIALILAILLLMPIRVRIAYQDGSTTVKLSAGPIRRSLYPPAEEPEKEPTEEPLKKAEKKAKKKADEPKKKRRINREQILYLLEKGPKILGRAIKRLGRRIRICPLKLYLLVAAEDPADTAILYGRISGGLSACLPELHRHIHIDDQDIQLFPDFSQDQMDVIADVGISLRIWDVLVIGVCAGCSLIKLLVGFRRRGDKETPEKKEKQKDTAQRRPDKGQEVPDVSANPNDEEKKNG